MAREPVRVLGVDTSLRCTGFAVVEARGLDMTALEYGLIRNPDALPHSECLRRLQEGIEAALDRSKPEAVAIEGIFFCRNVRTAIVLGEARGAVIAACARRGAPVYEYPPRQVKMALAGVGGARKQQVARMVMALLGLREEPPPDAADALAIAMCHVQQRVRLAGWNARPL